MSEPLSAFYSTALNNRIDSYDKLSTRILRQLGCPLQKLEIAREMMYEYIAMAIEHYTEYAGYTEEYLLFSSNLYVKGRGIKLDELVSTTTPELSSRLDPDDPNSIIGYDYDLMDYRKVVDVANFEEGSSTGVNILFSVQASMMQSLGFAFYGTGMNTGFDLISWYSVNEFLETRNKLIGNKIYFRFNPDTQLLTLFPEPRPEYFEYYGLIKCYVEKRMRDCLKNQWVQKYALALAKIGIANVRGKFGGTQLLGGGTVNFNDMMSQGLSEKEKLEEQLLNGTGGWANMEPAPFIVM